MRCRKYLCSRSLLFSVEISTLFLFRLIKVDIAHILWNLCGDPFCGAGCLGGACSGGNPTTGTSNPTTGTSDPTTGTSDPNDQGRNVQWWQSDKNAKYGTFQHSNLLKSKSNLLNNLGTLRLDYTTVPVSTAEDFMTINANTRYQRVRVAVCCKFTLYADCWLWWFFH